MRISRLLGGSKAFVRAARVLSAYPGPLVRGIDPCAEVLGLPPYRGAEAPQVLRAQVKVIRLAGGLEVDQGDPARPVVAAQRGNRLRLAGVAAAGVELFGPRELLHVSHYK